MRTSKSAVLGVTVLLLAGCGGGDVGTATPTGSAPFSTVSSPPPPPSSTPSTASPTTDAVGLVEQWLAAVSEGELAAAEATLGASSLAAVEEMGGLEAIASGLAEGMAAFGADGVAWSVVPVPDAGAHLVVASGEVEREGMREVDAHAWLVHGEDGRDVVEVFSSPAADVVPPGPDGAVTARLPAGRVVVAVDGAVVETGVETQAADDLVEVSVRPGGGWSTGAHVVAVAVVPDGPDADGPWAAGAVTFVAD